MFFVSATSQFAAGRQCRRSVSAVSAYATYATDGLCLRDLRDRRSVSAVDVYATHAPPLWERGLG